MKNVQKIPDSKREVERAIGEEIEILEDEINKIK